MKTTKRVILKNGLRLLHVPQPQSLTTLVMVLVEVGSKYETKDLSGISHFLEHMCFKGTAKRPRPIDIASELDGLGAEYNAFTSREYTSYYAKVRNEDFKQALDVISDIYLNSSLPEKEIEKEKGVIVEEINMYEDMPAEKVQELFWQLVYGDTPAGWPIVGKKEIVKGFVRKDFLEYHKDHYVPSATTVVIAGGVNEKEVRENIKKCFGNVEERKKAPKQKVKEKQKKPQELIHFKESDQAHLVLGFRAFDAHDERKFALSVFSNIVGGGMSSRLFQKIREELGAAYYIYSGASLLSDHGLFAVSAGVDPQKIEVVTEAIIKELRAMREKKVAEDELRRAKDHLIGNLFISLETSDELGYFYGRQEVMRTELKAPKDVAHKIEQVTREEVWSVAKHLLKPNKLNLALIGPYTNKSLLSRISEKL